MPPKRRGETSGAEPAKRRRWTPDEEAELQALVGKLGPDKWPAVAQRLGTGRSADAVEQHWRITPRASAPSAPREEASAAAPKPAKRARKSAAKRAARSAAKPAATLAGDSLAALPPGASGAAKRAPPTVPPPGTRVAVRFDDKDYDGTVGDAYFGNNAGACADAATRSCRATCLVTVTVPDAAADATFQIDQPSYSLCYWNWRQ